MTLTPKKLKTGIGSTVILSCGLTGSPEFTIRWYRNTVPVLPDEAVSIRGLSNETLLITSAQKSHSGAYQCFASRKAQTAQDFAIIALEGELGSQSRRVASGPPRPARRCPEPPCLLLGDTSQLSLRAKHMPVSSTPPKGPGGRSSFIVTYSAVEETGVLVTVPRSSDGQFRAGTWKTRLVGRADSGMGGTPSNGGHGEQGRRGAKWASSGHPRLCQAPGSPQVSDKGLPRNGQGLADWIIISLLVGNVGGWRVHVVFALLSFLCLFWFFNYLIPVAILSNDPVWKGGQGQ